MKTKLIISILAALACCVLFFYAYTTEKELSKYRHLYRQVMADVIADCHNGMADKLNMPRPCRNRIMATPSCSYSVTHICPVQQRGELMAAIQGVERTVESRLSDFHGYLCPDFELSVSETEPTSDSSPTCMMTVTWEFVGFRTPSAEERNQIIMGQD